jgi:replication factor A3
MTDTCNPRPMVNAGLLKKYLGRRVTTVVKVFRSDGADLVGQAPDGTSITVRKAASSSITSSHFVEVVGVVEGESALRAEICTNFGDAFGPSSNLIRLRSSSLLQLSSFARGFFIKISMEKLKKLHRLEKNTDTKRSTNFN